MAFRGFRENRTKIHTRTDQLVDVAHKIATEQLIPQVAQMSRNAVTVDRTEFYFYRRKRTGRRCSCFSVEGTPDSGCKICFNTGIVGGYDKFGCYEEILDVTRPGLRLLNVRPAYELLRRPVFFVLDDSAKTGIIEFTFDVRPNVHLVDLIQSNYSLINPVQSKVKTYIKTPEQSDFVALTDTSLSRSLYSRTITIQVRISRENPSIPSPLFRDVKLRYRLLDTPRIIADIPVRKDSMVLQEAMGIYTTSQQITMYLSDNPRKVGNEDFFIMVEEGSRWRVIESTPNKPSNQLTSTLLTCQNVPSQHPIYDFPV